MQSHLYSLIRHSLVRVYNKGDQAISAWYGICLVEDGRLGHFVFFAFLAYPAYFVIRVTYLS